MENFFGRLKVEMFYGEKIESVKHFYLINSNNNRLICVNIMNFQKIEFYILKNVKLCDIIILKSKCMEEYSKNHENILRNNITTSIRSYNSNLI